MGTASPPMSALPAESTSCRMRMDGAPFRAGLPVSSITSPGSSELAVHLIALGAPAEMPLANRFGVVSSPDHSTVPPSPVGHALI